MSKGTSKGLAARVAVVLAVAGAGCSASESQPKSNAASCPTGSNCATTVAGPTSGVPASNTPGPGGTTTVGTPGTTTGAAGAPTSSTAGAPATPPPTTGSAGAGTSQPMMMAPPPPPAGSSGCGASTWPPSGDAMIDVGGTQRAYIVTIPTGYDPKKFYKLVFAWHGLGGSAKQVAGGFGGGYYGLQNQAGDSTIFVAGQGLETGTMLAGMAAGSSTAGWANTNDQDIAFVKAMLDTLRASYCIDDKRIFSVGMSYGGIMSNTIGCELGGVFRAIAPMSGSGPRTGGFGGGAKCVGQVAVWMAHGNMDTTVPFASGQASRDHWVMNNHCMTGTMPVDPSRCVAYQGCDADYPVTWCEFDGAHTIWQPSIQAIWKFFSQF